MGETGRRLSAGAPEANGTGAWRLSHLSCYHFDLPWSAAFLAILHSTGKSLTELGAGKGCYTAYFKSRGIDVVAAVDGASNIGDLTQGLVRTWDLTKPMEARADWVMTLEV